ncbi:4-amino-4-deoxychorismate lyase [Alteromonadaceae bacterium Bs31]|nr:4-amino-4-deoxychorismate lyase [Alteromonadaceae bacterium Bs31]
MIEPDFFFVNGKPASSGLPSQSRAFSYGDGVFETARIISGRLPLWAFHQQRLQRGLSTLALNADLALVQANIDKLFQQLPANANGVLKVLVSRRGNFRASYASGPQGVDIFVYFYARNANNSWLQRAVELRVAQGTLPLNPSLAGIKHCSRLPYIVAAKNISDLHDGQEVLFLDSQNHLVETMHHNIFYVFANQLHTPKIQQVGVDGVLRSTIIKEFAPSLGLDVLECDIGLGESNAADEIFLCNAVAGLVPVNKIDGEAVPEGKLAPRIASCLLESYS